jgi:VWFA-related protein
VHDFTSKKLALLGKLADAGGVPPELPAGRLGEFAWVFDELKPAGLFGRDGVVESRRSASTLGAMRVAASNLSRLPGGKNIIWIGAGLSGGSLGSPLQPGATPGRGPSGTEVARMARIFTDCNAAFYWIDARPGAPAEAPGDAAMKEFARVSGGRVYSGGAHDAVRQALADTRVMYVVNFTPTSPEDGQYHQLKVQVTRPNVSVRYRDGYTSPAKRNE